MNEQERIELRAELKQTLAEIFEELGIDEMMNTAETTEHVNLLIEKMEAEKHGS